MSKNIEIPGENCYYSKQETYNTLICGSKELTFSKKKIANLEN